MMGSILLTFQLSGYWLSVLNIFLLLCKRGTLSLAYQKCILTHESMLHLQITFQRLSEGFHGFFFPLKII